MSITVTLDDDIVEKLKAESEARGTSVEGAVNDLLRTALAGREPNGETQDFQLRVFKGSGAPRYNLDCTARLLEEIEGPDWR